MRDFWHIGPKELIIDLMIMNDETDYLQVF